MDLLQWLEDNKILIGILVAIALIGLPVILYAYFRRVHADRQVGSRSNVTREGSESLEQVTSELRARTTIDDFVKNLEGQRVEQPGGWLPFELTICRRFAKLSQASEEALRAPENQVPSDVLAHKARHYLTAAHEADRKPRPTWVWFLWGVMVVAESYAFNLLLADYITLGGTPRQQQFAALGMCVLFSIGAMLLAHLAGASLYLHSLVRYVYDVTGRTDHVSARILIGDIDRTYDDNQEGGETAQQLQQKILNRSQSVRKRAVRGRPPKIDPIFGAIVVLLVLVMIAIFSFRVFDLTRKETQETTGNLELSRERAGDQSKIAGVPIDVAKAQDDAERAASKDQEGATRAAFYWAFGIFSFIFLSVQIVGIYIAYAFGFASDKGMDAYFQVRRARFESMDAYRAYYHAECQKLPSVAQETLAVVQEGVLSRASDRGMNLTQEVHQALAERSRKTFQAYMVRVQQAQAAGTYVDKTIPWGTQAEQKVNVLIHSADGEQDMQSMLWSDVKARIASGDISADRVSIQPVGESKFVPYKVYFARVG